MTRSRCGARHDRLPPALRLWLARAARPWSPLQALRIWRRHADPARAVAALTQAERLMLQLKVARNRVLHGGVARHGPTADTPPPPA